MNQVRSQAWLEAALHDIWSRHFDDVPVANVVRITYSGPSKTRLGWIALSESGQFTTIGINRLLRFPEVPEDVCIVTIAHEVVHYSHGFGSPLQQRHADPHAGGVVERDLEYRGLAGALARYYGWSSREWAAHYARHARGSSRLITDHRSSVAASASPLQYPTVAAMDVPAPDPGADDGGMHRHALDVPLWAEMAIPFATDANCS
jgi:hypothetical protein